jgi:exosortase family protein XrtF
MNLLREFKPALLFLGKFLGFYLVGNIIYGIYVESSGTRPDAITFSVASQTSGVLGWAGYDTSIAEVADAPKVALRVGQAVELYVFEGCNGVNVMIVFVAFLIAFGGPLKAMAFFLPIGILIIHLFNLLRIGLLFRLAVTNSTHFYYYHKYVFTTTLYLAVFALWALWVLKFNENRIKTA